MKITGGKFQRKSIKTKKGFRPTTSKVRKAVFDICQNIEGKTFLDLFAGSGAMGIEALSRGAKKSLFIEKEKAQYFLIKKNLKNLNIEKFSKVFLANSLFALKRIKQNFDIIYIDPPYDFSDEDFSKILKLINEKKLLAKDGILFLEAFKKREKELKEMLLEFFNIKIKRYGSSILMVCRF